MLQETKAEKGYVEKQVTKVCGFATVIETPNPANNNKGGVAIICTGTFGSDLLKTTTRLNEHGSTPYQPNNALKTTSREDDTRPFN